MIYVDRTKVSVPENLIKEGGAELKRNIIRAEAGKYKDQIFNAYKAPGVKDALVKLFKGKCAYCESTMLETYPGDIEHFRPKGMITEAGHNTHGYYWLAADWNNLLLSCRNCNQRLTHDLSGEIGARILGKMNQFPLYNGHAHLKTHIDAEQLIIEEDEQRLLINPCKDDPEELLQYDVKLGTISAKITDGLKKIKAEKSIEVFVLQRLPLVQARQKLLIEIWAQIDRVSRAVIELNGCLDTDDKDRTKIWEAILKRELSFLRNFTDPSARYSAMAKQIIDKFIAEKFAV